MKYFFADIIESYDGLEFSQSVIVKAADVSAADKVLNTAAQKWRDEPTTVFKGQINSEIPQADFDVLSKYLTVIN